MGEKESESESESEKERERAKFALLWRRAQAASGEQRSHYRA